VPIQKVLVLIGLMRLCGVAEARQKGLVDIMTRQFFPTEPQIRDVQTGPTVSFDAPVALAISAGDSEARAQVVQTLHWRHVRRDVVAFAVGKISRC